MNTKIPNLSETVNKRVVIVGGGFAGLKLARLLMQTEYQIVMIDKNNYHQFQPLLYQVAMSGLEPSSISFPMRKIFQNQKNIHFRIASLQNIRPDEKLILTDIGELKYDYLVLATGACTNYFGQQNIASHALPLKSAADSIFIRNTILENFEKALNETDPEKISSYLNVILVGGGPTGVELAGALAEMRKFIFPKDYPELDMDLMKIVIYEASPNLLNGMSEASSLKAREYLEKLGVEVNLEIRVVDYDGQRIVLSDDTTIVSKMVIWAAGVEAKKIAGINSASIGRGNRIRVDTYHRVFSHEDIFALGDTSLMETLEYPNGHPQVAQVAIQQADNLAKNLKRMEKKQPPKEFIYRNKGSMATIGRNLAVADIAKLNLSGFLAWFLWSFIHLVTMVGVKNKLFVFLNWSWNYFTYDQSLRLLIRHKRKIPTG